MLPPLHTVVGTIRIGQAPQWDEDSWFDDFSFDLLTMRLARGDATGYDRLSELAYAPATRRWNWPTAARRAHVLPANLDQLIADLDAELALVTGAAD